MAAEALNDAWGNDNVPKDNVVEVVHAVSKGSKETVAIKKAADFTIETTRCGAELAELVEET